MPLPPLATFIQVAWVQSLHTQELVNTLKCFFPDADDPAALKTLGTTMREQWGSRVLPYQSYQLRLERVEIRQLVPLSGVGVEVDAGIGYSGDNVVDADSTNTATAIKLATAQLGRSYRGRMFIGGTPNVFVQAGLIDETYREQLATSLNTLLEDIRDLTTANPVIVSYFSAGEQRITPVITSITEAITVTPYPASLASRKRVTS